MISTIATSQTKTNNVTISFTEANLRDVINSLEEKTQLKFYYIDDWLSNDAVTGNFTDASINEVLDALFQNTIINYYVLDGEKVILTQNNIIYDQLPNKFFEKSGEEESELVESEENTESLNPVFFPEEQSRVQRGIETVRIGKESLE